MNTNAIQDRIVRGRRGPRSKIGSEHSLDKSGPNSRLAANSLILVITIVVVLSAAVYISNLKSTPNSAGDLPDSHSGTTSTYPLRIPGKYHEWYVAPDGKPNGDGTRKAPWDLRTALNERSNAGQIKPGDIIRLGAGVYTGSFESTIKGTASAPIEVRPDTGGRVILDKNKAERETGTLNVRGPNVWFRDLEITNSFPDRNRLDADGELNPWRGSGINVYAPDTKYINLVIHDNGHGFGLWNEEGGTEIYGCVIFNNGNNKKEHGIYGHNKNGTQSIVDNVIFNGAGYGLHLYANSTKSGISGFDIEGNAVFNNGALTLEDQVADQVLVGGVEGVSAERVTIRQNYIYNDVAAPTSKNRGIRLGYEDKHNRDVSLIGNYIVSKVPLKILWWDSVTARDNTIYSTGSEVEVETADGKGISGYEFDRNYYIPVSGKSVSFKINDQKSTIDDWRSRFKTDATAASASKRDAGAEVFVRPNKYEEGRANIIVYNWSLQPKASTDLGKVLRKGDRYEVLDAQDLFGGAVVTGIFDGNPIALPMISTRTTKPVGSVEKVPPHTDASFGVFIVRRIQK